MKYRFLALLLLPLAGLCLWTGCGPDSAQEIYHFGQEYDCTQCIIKVDHEIAGEKFVYSYTEKINSTQCDFCFTFNYNTLIDLTNSNEFDYTTSDGNEIIFDASGHYSFVGDKIIYISYKNANNDIKAAIAKDDFSVYFDDFGPVMTLHVYPSDT